MKHVLSFLVLLMIFAAPGCGKEEAVKDGVKTTHFYKGGPVKSEMTYKNGQLNGSAITFYKDGVTRTETNYLNGKIHGTMKRYAPNGKLAGEAVFQNGVQVSEKRYVKEGNES